MIHYRDMTFCSGDGCRKFSNCHKALTEQVKEKAEKFGLPIAQWEEPRKQTCWEPEDETDVQSNP